MKVRQLYLAKEGLNEASLSNKMQKSSTTLYLYILCYLFSQRSINSEFRHKKSRWFIIWMKKAKQRQKSKPSSDKNLTQAQLYTKSKQKICFYAL